MLLLVMVLVLKDSLVTKFMCLSAPILQLQVHVSISANILHVKQLRLLRLHETLSPVSCVLFPLEIDYNFKSEITRIGSLSHARRHGGRGTLGCHPPPCCGWCLPPQMKILQMGLHASDSTIV